MKKNSRKINNKSIAFIAVFVSISTIMLLLGVRIFPFAILPNLRFSIIGLPIKITGFLFGPIIGLMTGILSDLITLWFVPSTYSVYYTLALSFSGFIPGVVYWLFLQVLSKKYSKEKVIQIKKEKIQILELHLVNFKDSTSLSRKKTILKIQKLQNEIKEMESSDKNNLLMNIYWITGLVILFIIVFSIVLGIWNLPEKFFKEGKFIKNKISFILLLVLGTSSMMVFISIARFVKIFQKNNRYFTMIPIIVFSAILEPLSSIFVSFGDIQSGVLPDFETALLSHFIISPVKIWFNLSIIYFTSLIIVPIVKKKISNSY